jgi:hypothetical protein
MDGVRGIAGLTIDEIRRLRAGVAYVRVINLRENLVAHLTYDDACEFPFSSTKKVAMTAAQRIDARDRMLGLVERFPAQAPYLFDLMLSMRLLVG